MDIITFAQNNGLGQDVKHYHLHLIPKYHNDEKLAIEEVYNKLESLSGFHLLMRCLKMV